MVSRKVRAVLLLSLTSVMALSHLAVPTAASAAEVIREVIEGVGGEPEGDEEPWYIPGVRKYRCELIVDMPAPEGERFKSCSYNCRGYGGPANFPWPRELACPVGYNGLMPIIPEPYPTPYPDGRPSLYAD